MILLLAATVSTLALTCAPALAMPQTGTAPAQAAPAATAWPQTATAGGATFVLNAPTYTAINGNTVSMQSTVQVKRGDAAPVDGLVAMSAVMAQASAPGYVELSDFQISSCTMPDGTGDDVQSGLASLLQGMGIESMLTNIVQGVAIDASRNVSGLSNAAPTIRVTERPAVLISVNGTPAFGSCGNGWQRVVNTPSILLKSPDGTWFTRVGGSRWLSAPAMSGPFAAASSPPSDVVAEIGRAPAPPAGTTAPQAPAAGTPQPKLPDVVVATQPTILVSIDGAPQLEAACDGVQWVANCSTPLLRANDAWWTLGSGRWFTTTDLNKGPWTYVPATSLPASFANLPAKGAIAPARASVPGTLEANSAAAASGLVRAITVPRSGAQCQMKYRGQPRFRPIDGGLSYATNASQPVIKTSSGFYCCDDGAWYTASSESGPWTVCDSVPAEIYAISPSCAAYPCTYVSVVASTPDSVTFGSSAGYMGTYMQDGVPVYGTGYDYNAQDPQPVDPAQANVPNYVAPSYPSTYGNQAQYSYDTGTYAPEQGYGYYGYADMYPSVYGAGYGGWGWSPYWGSAYGYGCGWGYGWGYGGDWGYWNRGWNNWGDRRNWNNAGNRDNANRVANENRWNTARMNADIRGGGGVTGTGAFRSGATGMNRAAGYGSPAGWHSPEGARGASGFSPARYGQTGGYRSNGGGSRGNGGGSRGGGGGRR
jgi:hypothetical protein